MIVLENIMNEKALILTGKHMYPKFGNILIMAGGAGSGKGFVLKNVLGFTGKVFDVDELKSMAIRYAKRNPDSKINLGYKEIYGKALADIDLRNSKDVGELHEYIKKYILTIEKRKCSSML